MSDPESQDVVHDLTNLSGYDSRQQEVLQSGRFFEPYREELRQLFHALGRDHLWSDNPRDLLPYIREGWIGGEHGNSATKDQFTAEQVAAAEPILEKLGLLNEEMPPDGTHYADILIVGATEPANVKRMRLVQSLMQNHGITADRIIFLVGQRPRETRDGTDEELLGTDGSYGENDVSQSPWVIKMREAFEASGIQMFDDETKLARLALMRTVPNGEQLRPGEIDLQVTDVTGLTQEQKIDAVPKRMGDLPPRLITEYHFKVPLEIHGETRIQKFVLLNGAAVQRAQGEPRHTTASVTREWLGRLAPAHGDEPIRILYISGNPHTVRTAYDSLAVIRAAGRDDIHMDIAGTRTALGAKGVPIQNFLGEIARLIDNDVRRNYPETTT